MRVAYLGIKGIPAKGGTERVVEAIATRMVRHGVEPTVYCGRYYTPEWAVVPGVRLVRLPSLPGKYFRATSLNVGAALHAVFRGRYDLVHVHNSEASFVLPLLRLRYKVISTRHGSAYLRAKWGNVAKKLLGLTDLPFIYLSNAVTSVSAQEAQQLTQKYRRQVAYIPNGVGSEYQPNHEAAQAVLGQHGLIPGEYLLFVAGRIEPTKGAHLAIAAVNDLGDAAPPLLVVGDDSHVPEYQQQLHAMAGPRVCFQRFVDSPATLFGVMAAARCLIFPSTVEAMSMVLLEAASLQVPVLCSDIPENREVMADNAVYFASGDAASLARQLRWVLDHGDEMRVYAERAKNRTLAEFVWDHIAARYADLYTAVGARAKRQGLGVPSNRTRAE